MTKKTIYVWIILILVAIGITFGFIDNIRSLVNIKTLLTPSFANSVTYNIIDLILSIAGTVLWLVYFIKLYNLPQNIIKWTNIAFGYSIFQLIFSLIVSIFTMPIIFVILGSIPTIIVAIIIGIIWFTFVRHLKRKISLENSSLPESVQSETKKFTFNKIVFKKIISIVFSILFLVFLAYVIINSSKVDVIDSRLILIQNKVNFDQASNSTVCDMSFVAEIKKEIEGRGKDIKCLASNDGYAVAAKREKQGYFCVDSKGERKKITANQYDLINANNIQCSGKGSFQPGSDNGVVINDKGQVVDKFIKGTFKIVDTAEVFEYQERYISNPGDLTNYNVNAVSNCVTSICRYVYFKNETNNEQKRVALFNSDDGFEIGFISDINFYRILSYADTGNKYDWSEKELLPHQRGDEAHYDVNDIKRRDVGVHSFKEDLCVEYKGGDFSCHSPSFKNGDEVYFPYGEGGGRGYKGAWGVYKTSDIVKTQLISYQYFTTPDTGEVFPLIQR